MSARKKKTPHLFLEDVGFMSLERLIYLQFNPMSFFSIVSFIYRIPCVNRQKTEFLVKTNISHMRNPIARKAILYDPFFTRESSGTPEISARSEIPRI